MDNLFERIPGRYGLEIERTGADSVSGRIPLLASLAAPDGSMRPAALLMGADMACGIAAGLGVLPSWSVTADAQIHLLAPCRVGPLRIDAACVRAGRKMAIADARLFDEGAGDQLVAVATANHGVLTPKFEPFLASTPIGGREEFPKPPHPQEQSLEAYFGVEIEAGIVRIPLGDRTRNPWGILHGGLHGLLIDNVARHALKHPRDIHARFLNPVRDGDAVAQVVERFTRDGNVVLRIEIRDSGSNRLAVMAHVVGNGGLNDDIASAGTR